MITAIMLPSFTKLGIVIDFKINRDFIAEVLCINRDKPMVMCYGTCYLSDKLEKSEEQERKQAPIGKKEQHEVVYSFFETLPDYLPLKQFRVIKLKPSYRKGYHGFDFVRDIFHPPGFVL